MLHYILYKYITKAEISKQENLLNNINIQMRGTPRDNFREDF